MQFCTGKGVQYCTEGVCNFAHQNNTDKNNTDIQYRVVVGGLPPPTAEDVKKYCSEKGYTFDPEKFFLRYQANGWTYKSNTIRDWKAVADLWQKNERPKEKTYGAAYDISEYENTSIYDFENET